MADKTVLRNASDLLTTFGVREFDIHKAEDRYLLRSIRMHGVQMPVVISPSPDGDLVIDGHRRVGAIIYLQRSLIETGPVPCVYQDMKVLTNNPYEFF